MERKGKGKERKGEEKKGEEKKGKRVYLRSGDGWCVLQPELQHRKLLLLELVLDGNQEIDPAAHRLSATSLLFDSLTSQRDFSSIRSSS